MGRDLLAMLLASRPLLVMRVVLLGGGFAGGTGFAGRLVLRMRLCWLGGAICWPVVERGLLAEQASGLLAKHDCWTIVVPG